MSDDNEESSGSGSNNAAAVWTLGIVLLVIGIFVYSQFRKRSYMRAHPVYTTGTIIKKYQEARGEQYVTYSFLVDTTTFNGRMPIKFCLECHDSCCVIGGKVKVRYAEGDPGNNELVH